MKELILYTSVDGNVKVEVTYSEGSFWLSQRAMSLLLNKARVTISGHLTQTFDTKELDEKLAVRNFRTSNYL